MDLGFPSCDGGPEFRSCVLEVLRLMGWGSAASREGLCAIGSLREGVHVFPMSQPGAGVLLRAGPRKGPQCAVGGTGRGTGYLQVSGAEGLVYHWQVEVEMRHRTGSKGRTTVLSCLPVRNAGSLL